MPVEDQVLENTLTAHVEPLLARWSGSPEGRTKALQLLAKISAANGGKPIDDGENSDGDTAGFLALSQARQAVERRLNLYANSLLDQRQRRLFLDIHTGRENIDLFADAAYRPVVSVNTASWEELEALPAIGPELARRIIEFRHQNGTIRSPADLDRIPGIGPSALERLDNALSYDTEPAFHTSFPALAAFLERPDFDRYLDLVQTAGVIFSRPPTGEKTAEAIICCELESILEELHVAPKSPSATPGQRGSSAVARRHTYKQNAAQIRESRIHDLDKTALVFDRNYRKVVQNLVEGATSRIWIMMFFMRFDPTRQTPLNDLIQALCDARDRGVDVRVILDRDDLNDPARSHLINRDTVEFLKQHGVQVRQDGVERNTHSKFVLVDGEYTLLGSHNWTLSSFFAYDDTTLHIRSASLNSSYRTRFEGVWQELGT